MVSVLFVRTTITVIGVSANTDAAISAAFSPAHIRTVQCSRKIAATPSMTCGSSTDQLWKPKIRTEITCGHNDNGGLSMVTTPAGSSEPNRKFGKPDDIDMTAAVEHGLPP